MPKSKTCKGRDGQFLSEYYSEGDALSAAEHLAQQHGVKLKPYRCSKCEMWHLSPPDRITPSKKCSECHKAAYKSKSDAERRADIIYREKGTSLRVYECPYGNGWHLTKG